MCGGGGCLTFPPPPPSALTHTLRLSGGTGPCNTTHCGVSPHRQRCCKELRAKKRIRVRAFKKVTKGTAGMNVGIGDSHRERNRRPAAWPNTSLKVEKRCIHVRAGVLQRFCVQSGRHPQRARASDEKKRRKMNQHSTRHAAGSGKLLASFAFPFDCDVKCGRE